MLQCAQVTRCVWFALSVIVLIMPAILDVVAVAVLHQPASLHMLSRQQADCLSVSSFVCLSVFRRLLIVFRQPVSQWGCQSGWLVVWPFDCCRFPDKRFYPLFMSSINDALGWHLLIALMSSACCRQQPMQCKLELERTSNVTHYVAAYSKQLRIWPGLLPKSFVSPLHTRNSPNISLTQRLSAVDYGNPNQL